MLSIHLIWSGPIQIMLAMYFLWDVVGPSSMAGLGIMVLLLPINAFFTRKSRVLSRQILIQKDARIKEINEVRSLILSIAIVKLLRY